MKFKILYLIVLAFFANEISAQIKQDSINQLKNVTVKARKKNG